MTIVCTVLIRVEIVARVWTDREAHFFWRPQVEYSHDCFVCRRTRRTVIVESGQQEGRCVSGRKPSEQIAPGVHSFEEVSLVHPAPIRISAFDTAQTSADDGQMHSLRCQLMQWWAPFNDTKRDDPASTFSQSPWVRLHYHLGCRACFNNGNKDGLGVPGPGSTQTNSVWPERSTCPTCDRQLLLIEDAPAVTLVE